MPGGLRKPPSEAGQAVIEAVVLVPVFVILLTCMVDVGRFVALGQDLRAAATLSAATVEAHPETTEAQLADLVGRNYAALGSAEVGLEGPVREEVPVDYKIYSAGTGTFTQRPSKAAADVYEVKVTARGRWISPAMSAVAAIAGDGAFGMTATATARVDKTREEW